MQKKIALRIDKLSWKKLSEVEKFPEIFEVNEKFTSEKTFANREISKLNFHFSKK